MSVVRAGGAIPRPAVRSEGRAGEGYSMARKKSEAGQAAEPEAVFAGPLGTYVYFIVAANGTVLAKFGAGTSTLDNLLGAGWTALRETPLAGGAALLVLKR